MTRIIGAINLAIAAIAGKSITQDAKARQIARQVKAAKAKDRQKPSYTWSIERHARPSI